MYREGGGKKRTMLITINVTNAENSECCNISNPGPLEQLPGQDGLTVLPMNLSMIFKTAGLREGFVTHCTHIRLFSCVCSVMKH